VVLFALDSTALCRLHVSGVDASHPILYVYYTNIAARAWRVARDERSLSLALARPVLRLPDMHLRVVRPALIVALLFACNSGSSGRTSEDGSPSTSNPSTDPGGTGGAGSNGTASSGGSGAGSSGGSSSGGSEPLDPGPPHVQYIGRFDKSDPNAPRCAYAGCRIVARFDGTKVKAKMQEFFYDWMEAAPSEWDVIVDGQTKDKLVMTPAETEFVLADGLAQGTHVVELYKRSEPQTGATQFKGFDFGGGTLLSPPARKHRS
jgi:hypothetical protein